MKTNIEKIAKLQSGYSFRKRIQESKNGKYGVLQINDFGDNGRVIQSGIVRTNIKDIKSDYLVRPDDVCITVRGDRRRAVYIGRDLPQTVFGAQIVAIRICADTVLPRYLAWYLNQKPAQSYLTANASGSFIKNIKKSVLDKLPIFAPSLDKQKQIVKIYELHTREKELVRLIQERRDQIVEQSLLKSIK